MARPQLPANLSDLVSRHGGKAEGDGLESVVVSGVATLEDAGPGDLSFFSDVGYRKQLEATSAGVVALRQQHADLRSKPRIIVEGSPRDYVARLVDECCEGRTWPAGIFAGAIVDDEATAAASAHVGSGAVIAAGARLGERTSVLARAVVTEGCSVGDDCLLHEGCVIGSEGFGFYGTGPDRRRFKHQGSVVIGDRVEIGANSCVDRGVLGDTVIGSGTKVDNLVQVGHNVRIGEDCVICGCVAIGGSVVIGDGCVIGGGSLIKDHVRVADGVSLMGGTNVVSDIDKPGGIYGSAIPHMPRKSLMLMWRRMLKAGQRRRRDEDG